MAAYVGDDSDDLWELAMSYVDIFLRRHPSLFQDRASPLTDLDKVELHRLFRAMKQCSADLLTPLDFDLDSTHIQLDALGPDSVPDLGAIQIIYLLTLQCHSDLF